MSSDQQIQDAEILTDNDNSTSTPANQAEILLSLGELIKSHIQSVDKLRTELKEQKQVLEDVFLNDEVYRDHAEKAKEASKQKAQTRHQIMQQPAVAQIAQKIKSLNTEVKEKRMALSDYLLEYQRMAGVNEIEGHDGEVREIVNEAKVIRKFNK